jgi:hypothetical protein
MSAAAAEELELLVQAMADAEPATVEGDEDNAGDVLTWKISYSTFRN